MIGKEDEFKLCLAIELYSAAYVDINSRVSQVKR